MRFALALSASITAFVVLGCGTVNSGPSDTIGVTDSGPSGTIAVTGGSLHTTRQIILISPALNGIRRLTAPDDVVRFDLSPDGSQLVVTSFHGIWLIPLDGSDARRISEQGAAEIAWSPDGDRLAFASGDAVLFTMSAEGEGLDEVLDDAYQPDWTPDGEQIVFVRHPAREGGWDGVVSVVNSDGHGLRRIVDRGTWNDPHVSPDGSEVTFVDDRGIFVAAMKGGNPRLLVRDGYGPAWSPDGRYIAFSRPVRCYEVCASRVFIAPASGGKAHAYGPVIGDMGPLSWSR
jgi:WD40 repeat protein